MKWSEEKIAQLKTLAFAGKSNKDIAQQLGISINDVYAKRSQLGITIDKVKTMQAKTPQEVKTQQYNEDRFARGRELDAKRCLIKLLEPAIIKADESVKGLELADHGKVVNINFTDGTQRIAFVEGDSLMAIIADVTRKCLF